MNQFNWLKNEKGIILISVYAISLLILILSGATFTRSFIEANQVDHEVRRLQSFAAAEAGIQNALAQIGQNAYTGFINTASINSTSMSNYNATTTAGNFSATISYPNQADWATVRATGTATNGTNVVLEGQVFLDSNLSKYMMYSTASTHGYGANLQIGYASTAQGASSQGVPSNPYDRNLLYYTGNLSFSGSNVNVYGDIHVQSSVSGNNYTGSLRGDSYIGSFATNSSGVTNTGITSGGNITFNDGFSDDLDRNGDGIINSTDAPDIHGLNSTGTGDAKKTETLTPINLSFYQTNNNTPSFAGASPQTRYLKLEVASNGTSTRVVEYTNGNFTTATGSTYTLPTSAIVYVNGNVYVQGNVKGRVSIVSSNNIMFTNNVRYGTSQSYVDPSQAVAFLAQKQAYFLPSSLEVSGIIYAQNSTSASAAVTAAYKLGSDGTTLVADGGAKTNGHFRHFGNIILGANSISTAQYVNDRVFTYDPLMKYYRPPGLPVIPSLRVVREAP